MHQTLSKNLVPYGKFALCESRTAWEDLFYFVLFFFTELCYNHKKIFNQKIIKKY